MFERLWFSLCAVAAVVSVVLGAIVAAMVAAMALDGGRLQWDAAAIAVTFAFIGPLACRFIYRWGLWVAHGSR